MMNINKLYHFSKMTQVKTESMNQINDYFLLINFFILNNNNLYFFILNKSIILFFIIY